jgi:ATP-dependent Lon protease
MPEWLKKHELKKALIMIAHEALLGVECHDRYCDECGHWRGLRRTLVGIERKRSTSLRIVS